MKRVLYGERIESITEFTGENLSDVLVEVALFVRDLEAKDSSYASIKQSYDALEDCITVIVYEHVA